MTTEERRFTLPKTPAATKWVHASDALRNELKAKREKLAADIRTKTAEVEQLDQALHYLNQILPPRATPANGTVDLVPTKLHMGQRWSGRSAVQVDACIDCGRDDVAHLANGRCVSCDNKWRHTKATA